MLRGDVRFEDQQMFLSPRVALVRNVAVAVFNGAIALIILLIAPMGLAGVITNTTMITVASFLNATACDRIVLFLQASTQPPPSPAHSPLERDQAADDLNRNSTFF